ncbi:MAG: DUF4870 domain-containing protein [Chloroflexota bacterium]
MQSGGDNSNPGGGSTGTGLTPNVAGALCYVLGFITGIIFLMMEKDRFVRFHAYQSILLSAAWVVFWIAFTILSTILGMIPFLGFIVVVIGLLLSLGLGLGGFVLFVILIVRAYQGQTWKLPYIGAMAERYANQG